MTEQWGAILTTSVVCLIIMIPAGILLYRYERKKAREREALRKRVEEEDAYLRSIGVELGVKRYVYDAETDSFVREREES